jgi:hypothetical protein
MAAQRAVYYLRVARKIVHAVQAPHPDPLGIAKRRKVPGASACVQTLVSRQRSASDVSSRPSQRACPPTPSGTRLRAGASQKPKRALAYLLSTLEIVRYVLRHEDVTLRAPYHNGQSSFSFIDILHSRETERLNLFGWRGLEIESDCAGFAEFKEVEDMMLSFSRFEARDAASPLHGEVCSAEARLARELCADGVADALLDEAEQFGFDVVAGEFERELLGAFTVTRLREDLVDRVLNGLGGRLVGAQIDPCAGPMDVSGYLFLIFGKAGRDYRNAVRDRHVYSAVATVSDEEVDLRHDLCVGQERGDAGVGGDGNRDGLGWLAACGDDDRDIFPATECDERRCDDLAEVVVGDGALRD